MVTRLLIATAIASLALAGCGKKADAPKTEAEIKTEKDAAAKSVRDNAVWGTQVQAHDKAKDVQKTMDKQFDETQKKIDDAK